MTATRFRPTTAKSVAGGSILAEERLDPISFYDVDSIALELAVGGFDEVIERLGGAPGGGLAEAREWMAGAEPERRTLEVVRLKLAAFADVCRGVEAVHAAGRPHLGVSPANVVAFEARAGAGLPANWRLRFALTDLGGAIPVSVPGTGETLWQPGREVSEDETSSLFLAPSLRSLEGGSVTMPVACREVADGGQPRLVVDVHRAGVPPFVLPGDLVIVQPVGGGLVRSARVDEVGARQLTASVWLEAATDGAQAWAGTTFEAKLVFVRRSSPSADLYGLGMMLLRIVLVHDEQALAQVAETVERCLHHMAVVAAQSEDGADLTEIWQQILDGERGEGRFSSWHVLARRSDRQSAFDAELQGRPIVPPDIWRDLMGLAGRLLLAPPVSRGDDRSPRGPLAAVLAEVRSMERRVHVELFDRDSRRAAIGAACTHVSRAVARRAQRAGHRDGGRPARSTAGDPIAVGSCWPSDGWETRRSSSTTSPWIASPSAGGRTTTCSIWRIRWSPRKHAVIEHATTGSTCCSIAVARTAPRSTAFACRWRCRIRSTMAV